MPVKIVQLLVLELGPSLGDVSFSNVINAHADEEDSEDEDWEDSPDGMNVPGFSKEGKFDMMSSSHLPQFGAYIVQELMALGGSGRQSRQADDATYVSATPGYSLMASMLTDIVMPM